MISIYDAKTEQLRIGPYSWTPFPHVDFWLQQDDKQILEVSICWAPLWPLVSSSIEEESVDETIAAFPSVSVEGTIRRPC